MPTEPLDYQSRPAAGGGRAGGGRIITSYVVFFVAAATSGACAQAWAIYGGREGVAFASVFAALCALVLPFLIRIR